MRAAVLTGHGGMEVVQYVDDLPIPDPAAGEVRVAMKAAALNRLDLFVRLGWPGLNLHLPHIIGSDGAGVVDAVGAGVTEWQVGDAVAINPTLYPTDAGMRTDYENQARISIKGEHASGFAAEYVCVPARNLVKMPAGFSFEEAAAAGLVYITAWHSLITRGQLRPGEQVLIVGAGGGVNLASLQIAKLAGAHVTVIGSDAAKCARARSLGADAIIDRSATPDWQKEVMRLTGRQGVDVVVDNAGKDTLNHSIRSLRIGGRLLVVGGTSGYNAELNIAQVFTRQIAIIGSTMGTQKDYATVMSLLFAGHLKAIVDSVHPLSDGVQAQTRLASGEVFGKVVFGI